MSTRGIMPFPDVKTFAHGQPSFRLLTAVALARHHWRMARNDTWPAPVRVAHQSVHDIIEEALARYNKDANAQLNEALGQASSQLYSRMNGLGMVGTSGTLMQIYIGAGMTLDAFTGALIDSAR